MKELIYRYTCECCKVQFERRKDEGSPLTDLFIPMKRLDETGFPIGVTAEHLWACADCMELIEKGISTVLKIYDQSYVGVICEKKGER